MVRQDAAKTEAMFTSTCDCRNNPTKIPLLCATFHSEFAVWSWTPLQIIFVVYICTSEKHLISICKLVLRHQSQ